MNENEKKMHGKNVLHVKEVERKVKEVRLKRGEVVEEVRMNEERSDERRTAGAKDGWSEATV